MNTVQEPEILIVFRTIVLNKIIWSIYCIKAPGSISAKILCLKRQHVFKVQNNGEFFKNILVVKMRTQSSPFAGRGWNPAVFMENQPQLNSRKPEALTVLWVQKTLPGCVWYLSHTIKTLDERFWEQGRILSFFPCTNFLFVGTQPGGRWPTMQERDRAAAEAQIPKTRKQENQFSQQGR